MPYCETRHGPLHYLLIGGGRPLVLIHGNTYTSATQERLARRFTDEHHVYSIDLLAHGRSARPEGLFSTHYFMMQGEAIADLINTLFPDAPVPVFGMSAGGVSALNAICLAPKRFAAPILDGIFYQVSTATVIAHHNSRASISPTWERFMRTQHGDDWWPQLQDGVDEAITLLAEHGTVVTPCLEQISVPTLIFQGGRDLFVPDEMAYAVAERISGAQVIYDAEAGHLLAWKDPGTFREQVRSFLYNLPE